MTVTLLLVTMHLLHEEGLWKLDYYLISSIAIVIKISLTYELRLLFCWSDIDCRVFICG